jgi:hypothetical protein
MAVCKRIDEVWAFERCRRLFWRVLLVCEWAAREETDRLRDSGLEEAAKLGMCQSMRGENLSKGKECRQSSALVLVKAIVHKR